MAAIFGTPLAAIMLALELLLFEWKPRSLVPVAIASITAGTTRQFLLGVPPIFPAIHYSALPPTTLGLAAVVGLAVGFASAGLTVLVYFFEDRFGQLRIHWMWWPALGGLVVGVGGLIEPRVLGVGYDTIHALLNGTVASPTGIVTRGDLMRALRNGQGEKTLLSAGSRTLVVASPDELLSDAAAKMLRARIGRLPVVDPKDPTKLVGYLGRGESILGYEKSHQEEHHREGSWLLQKALNLTLRRNAANKVSIEE